MNLANETFVDVLVLQIVKYIVCTHSLTFFCFGGERGQFVLFLVLVLRLVASTLLHVLPQQLFMFPTSPDSLQVPPAWVMMEPCSHLALHPIHSDYTILPSLIPRLKTNCSVITCCTVYIALEGNEQPTEL